MKNIMVSLVLLLAGAFMVALPQTALSDEGEMAPGTESGYIIKEGDTLWDISGSRLSDPFKWERIWKENPNIKDPDLIYPGEKIVIPGMEEGAPAAGTSAPEAGREAGKEEAPAPRPVTGAEAPFAERGKTVIKTPPKGRKVIPMDEGGPSRTPVATETEILSAGFIAADLPEPLNITGSPIGEREAFIAGDQIYVKAAGGMRPGDRYIAGRSMKDVEDPSTGETLGVVFLPTGVLRMMQKDGKVYLGTVERAFLEVKKSDLLFPISDPVMVYEPVPVNERAKGAKGFIVEAKGEKQAASMGDVIFIDLGLKDGVMPGDRFSVTRPGGEASFRDGRYITNKMYDLPEQEVGEVQVIAVQAETATARVNEFKEPLRKGFRIYYKY